MRDAALRDQLVRLLDWEEAHVGFDAAVAGIPAEKRGTRPVGFAHSAWQLLEHMRLAQDDIHDFCVNANYTQTLKWPDDYWPEAVPPNDAAWEQSVASFVRTREKMKGLVRDVADLTTSVPTGTSKQTFLRAVLLVADHAAYHVGQLVALRRALGIWGS